MVWVLKTSHYGGFVEQQTRANSYKQEIKDKIYPQKYGYLDLHIWLKS